MRLRIAPSILLIGSEFTKENINLQECYKNLWKQWMTCWRSQIMELNIPSGVFFLGFELCFNPQRWQQTNVKIIPHFKKMIINQEASKLSTILASLHHNTISLCQHLYENNVGHMTTKLQYLQLQKLNHTQLGLHNH
jgi:hypothetical protein